MLFLSFITKAQTDSLLKRSNRFCHFAGIDIGYSGYDPICEYKAETNVNYVFNPQYFIAKVQLGIAPATNFGTLKKGFIGIGFSTKTNKVFSWHLITGLGIVSPTTKTYTRYESYGNNPKVERSYGFSCGTPYIETGFYVKPMKQKRLILGLNVVAYSYDIYDLDFAHVYYNGPAPNINFSINYKLNK